jgi:hypothetical protein
LKLTGNITKEQLLHNALGLLDNLCRFVQYSIIQSFNIISAAAGSLGDIDTCRQLYEWMRSEGRTNSFIKPDRITLRNMFQAISLHASSNQEQHGGGVVEAARECEQLVQHYLTESSLHDAMPIYQALIHVWALADPWQARAYLLVFVPCLGVKNPKFQVQVHSLDKFWRVATKIQP